MKRFVLAVFSVLIFSTGTPLVIASELMPLQHRADLWQQVQQGINHKVRSSLVDGVTQAKSSELQFILVKATSGKISFEHYDTLYQGYPVLNGRLILAKNAQGQLQQMLGALAAGISTDLPNAAAEFTQNELAVKRWLRSEYQVTHLINDLELYPAIFIDNGLAKAVYRIRYLLSNQQGISIERPHMIVDARTLQVIKQWDGLDKLQESASSAAITGTLVMAGGAGGNEALGLNCYTPSPNLMAQCLAYEGFDDPIVSEVIFQNLKPQNIYSAFSGYPFIVTQQGSDCWLKNDYVTTIKALKGTPSDSAFQYACDGNTEHFDKQSMDTNDYYFLSFFPINDAHFYAGIVMQMYDQYLRDIYPTQLFDCSVGDVNSSYCLKSISQRANAKGETGADMSNANWDGEYVNYGNGGPYEMYSQTTIDIVAHEITHAITEWNSDPIWDGQSKALDESFSDIAAIAVNDFFERHLSGSYASSVLYREKRKYNWRYGWDVFLYGWGGRDFQWPSADGKSIGDARDFEQGMRGHSAGGVMNKLFYELVTRQGWSIAATFKLMLEANVSCWSPQVVFEDAGTCLLLLTSDVDKFRQLDQTLHSVGIFSPQSDITPLPFEITQQDNEFGYKILLPASIEAASINKIEVVWGDDTPTKYWHKDSAIAIEHYLAAVHGYTDAGTMLVAIKLTLDDGSELRAFKNIYMDKSIVPEKDLVPDSFAFVAAVNVPLAEMVMSASIEVTGINAASKIGVVNGEYSIDGGDFTAHEGLVTSGQQVVVKLLSSAIHSDSVQAVLAISDVSAAFVVTTMVESIEPDNSNTDDGSSGSRGGVFGIELLLLLSFMGIRTRSSRRFFVDKGV